MRWNAPLVSKCFESASGSALGSALGFAVAKVLIINRETLTISMWSTDGGSASAGGTGGNDGLLTQMERCNEGTHRHKHTSKNSAHSSDPCPVFYSTRDGASPSHRVFGVRLCLALLRGAFRPLRYCRMRCATTVLLVRRRVMGCKRSCSQD